MNDNIAIYAAAKQARLKSLCDFFFSGIASETERELLLANGATHLLVDPFDFPLIADYGGPVALDSGAYRAFKKGYELTPEGMAPFYRSIDISRFAFITTCDVLGNPQKSIENWRTLRDKYGVLTMPVWQWGAPYSDLLEYLDGSPIVGLGGTVPIMRDKARKDFAQELTERGKSTSDIDVAKAMNAYEQTRIAALERIGELLARYPRRFHFFGLCWMRAVNELAPLLYSADSSFWLEGARRRFAVFKNTKTGLLSHAPQAVIPAYKGLGREALLASNIHEIQSFFFPQAEYVEGEVSPAIAEKIA